MRPRHPKKKKVRTQNRYSYRPDPKGRVTSRGPGIKGAPGSKVPRYEKSKGLMASIRKKLGW